MTTLIEFSRGAEHGGYASAFRHLSEEILDRACVLYIDVPYEESLRKNRRRFNPIARIRSWSTACRTRSWSACTRKWIGRAFKGEDP